VTQRSVLTTQSKLAVQALPGRTGFPPNAPSLAHGRQHTSLCAAPYFGSVAFTEFANSAYVKTSRSCDTASQAWVGERGTR
jgi:hypothetical protein